MRRDTNLPGIDDIDKLADFFDRTDTQEQDWEDADVEFKKPELVHVSVRLPKEDVAAIKKAARKKGLGYTTYIRMALREAIKREGFKKAP
ncbi:CopG antitoxin of type II toxin-antitoxin system [Neomoorella glycerini]|uniref:CopG antitoxin of type II toxin-antitoxin system n=1 Tax=Neomoorella glycerini TaxID=55779 RepID=A0A6I5ZWS1_9FIRM|nr:CopG family antitoxin [Moorella glycerini]QGP93771.1 CopG antitoxin of type II toxin-antitoxin system [Moorella glycerini]